MSGPANEQTPLGTAWTDSATLLIQSIQDYAMFLVDPDGRVASWSPGSEAVKGYPSEDILGRHFSVFYLPGDAAAGKPQNDLERASAQGRFEEEGWRLRKDGSRVWANIVITALRDSDGALKGFANVTRDITDRRRTRASLDLHSLILKMMTEGLCIVRPSDMVVLFANPRCAGLMGYPPGELEGKPTSIAHASPGEDRRADIEEQLSARGQARYEAERIRKDGSHFWLNIRVSALHHPEHGAVWVFLFDDITARKQAEVLLRQDHAELEARVRQRTSELESQKARREEVERALTASEDRFARLANSGILGVVVAEFDGRVLDANDTFLQMVGYTREELASGEIWHGELMTPGEVGPETGTPGTATVREREVLRKDGTLIPVLVGGSRMEERTFVAFVLDLTEKKRAESALQRTEEQLRQMQKMDAVGRLAGGVAHDFNNMLAVILSYSDVLLSELEPSNPMSADLYEIREAARRAANLTKQLLLFSRQQVTESKVVDLGDVFAGMDGMLRRMIGEDIQFTSPQVKGLGRVRVDPTHIEQVFLNLAVNARDAMPSGGKLTVKLENVELDGSFVREHLSVKAGPHVMLAVTDTGCGMDKATQRRIFEPFFTTKPKGKGTGLGLSTVFGIVQQSGGSIWVDSEPGKGTTFKIYLPRVDEPADSSVPLPSPTTLQGTETVLLVEDEVPVRMVVLNILQRNGYQVLEAASAGDALLVSEAHPGAIHLLLTDVVMPRMSGPELARRLVGLRPSLRVLCMSGYLDDNLLHHGAKEGGYAFVQKPFMPTQLLSKVREVLDSAAPLDGRLSP